MTESERPGRQPEAFKETRSAVSRCTQTMPHARGVVNGASMPKPSKLISIPEAARILGWSPQRLRRHLLRRERAVGQRIMVRVGEGTERVRYLVSLSALKDHEPTLFQGKRDEMADAVRRAISEFSRELSEMNERIAQLELNSGKLGERVRAVLSSSLQTRKAG